MKVNPKAYLSDPHKREQRDKDLKKACRDFESIFTYQLLKTMRQTVEKCELFHGGQGEEIYESLLDMELAKRMAGSGPGSLTDLLYRQLKGRAEPEEARPEALPRPSIPSKHGVLKDPPDGRGAIRLPETNLPAAVERGPEKTDHKINRAKRHLVRKEG